MGLIDMNTLLAILASKALEPRYQHANEDYFVGIADALGVVIEQVTVEAITVVRCKDCKHCEHGCKCRLPLGASLYDNDYILVESDDFCSYGERKV